MATQALPPGFSFVDDEPVTPPAAKAASGLPAGFSFVDEEPVKVAHPKQGFLPGTEEFGGKVPGVPEPRNPITQPKSDTPEFVKAAYEGKFGVPAPANLGTAFKEPWESVVAGVEQMAEPAPLPTATGRRNPRTGQPYTPAEIPFGPEQAVGASKIIRGAAGALSGPESIGPMIAASPVGAPLTLGAAKVAGVATEKGLTAAGVPPEYAGLGGDVISLAVAGGGARYLVGKADAALEAHNAAAARWLEQERTGGLQKEQMDEIFAGESHPITVNGKEATVEYMGASKKGRTGFRVVDADGKVLVGGRARDVQDWLQSNGAAPLPSDKAVPIESLKEPPAIVREAPAQAAPALPEGFEYAEPPAPAAEFTKGQEFKTPEGTYRVKNVKGVTVQARLETPDGKNVPVMASIERFKDLVGAPAVPASPAVPEPIAAPTPANSPSIAVPTPSEATLPEAKAPSIEPTSPSSTPAPVTPEPEVGAETPEKNAHDYSTTQVNLPESIAVAVRKAGADIPRDQLTEDGVEKDPHVTVKYGLTGEDHGPVRETVAGHGPVTVKLGKASVFHTPDADVLKVDVDSPDLHALNAKVSKLPNEDKHPDYIPHATIAYLKPGQGAQYDGKEIPGVTGQEITLDSVSFRDRAGNATDIQLGEKPESNRKVTGKEPVKAEAAVGKEAIPEQKLPPQQPAAETPKLKQVSVDRTAAESRVLQILGRKKMDAFSLPEYFGSDNTHDYEELIKALIDLIRKGDVQHVQMDDGGRGFQRIAKSREVAAAPENSIVESERNASDATAGENPEALAGVPSEDVRGDGEGGNAPRVSPERGQVNEGLDSSTGGTGTAAEPGEGSDQRAVGVPAGGERPAGDRRGADRGSTPTSTDYRITPADHIGEGSIKQKANDNLAAIRLLKQIEAEGREATPDEQKALVKYVGWGGMPQPFVENGVQREWQGVRAELDSLLTPEEFASARASTPNAHYTSSMVIEGIWNALGRLGFSPHETYTMLEPAMGAGHFFGMTPEGIADRAQRVGIELDSITGRIAKLLYPQVDVHVSGFEKVRLPNDYFDLAVSNVPFGNYGVHDPAYKRTPGVTRSIHDYFFAKALDKVRPGGVVAFITSNYTMDKGDPFIRKYLADRADLLGAIRLPNTAFKGNAGTEVTTDIIFLQKRPPQVPASGEKWAETQPVSATKKRPDGTMGDGAVQVNEYFARHPEMMLGKMGLEGTMYGPNQAALIGDLTPEKFQSAIDKLPQGVVLPWKAPEQPFTTLASIPSSGAVKEGAFAIHDGQVVVRQGDKLAPADIPADQATRIKAMMGVRDAVREVFRTQIEESTDRAINMAREKLNLVYDIFVKKHGYLHDRKNVRAYADDPDAPLVLSLEDWDPDTKTAKKTAVFKERTIDKYKPAEKADNATDALSISLNERGRLDWVRMQELTGKTPVELQDELGPLVYQNPAGKGWEPADEYLSGNVRSKLAEAESAARGNKAFERNVEALKAVQPKDLEPGEINGRLGASWIPKEDVRDFVAQLLEMEPRTIHIGHSEALATWTMKLTRPETVANKRTYGTDRFTGAELIDDALNLRNPTAYDWVGSGSERRQVVNEQQTLAARQMFEQIKEKFGNWVWEDPERAKRLAETYNQEFNSLRLREYDGSHLSFPGSSAAITLRKHQKNAAWRMIQAGNTLLAHVVGAGKAQPLSAKLLTPTGWKLMGDIQVGDHVIAGDGSPTLVEAVFPQGQKDIFRVEFSDGASTECCDEHLWATQTYLERSYGQRAKKLGKTTWACGDAKVRPLSEIKKSLRSDHLNALNHSIPVVGQVQFSHRSVPLDPYLLGVLLGDGCFRAGGSVMVSSADEEILDSIAAVLPDTCELVHHSAYDYRIKWKAQTQIAVGELRVSGHPVNNALRCLGLFGKYSHEKHVPEEYLFNSVETRVAILQGLLDTDGTVGARGTSINFCTTSEQLSQDVRVLVQSLGGIVRTRAKAPSFTHKGVRKIGRKAFDLCICLPPSVIPFRLSRKAKRVKPKTKYAPARYVTGVVPVGRKTAQCIRVAHPSHLYVTDDFIVTHNTLEIVAGAMEMRRLGLAKKPMIVVPKNRVGGTAEEFLSMYPAANILVMTSEDLTPANRQKMMGRIATGNWDSVIVSYESFEKLPVSDDTFNSYLQTQIDDLENYIRESKGDQTDARIVKELEKSKKRLEAKLRNKADRESKDEALTFEELGVDQLFVDEFDSYKNKGFNTKLSRIAGIPNTESKRAFDMYIKSQHIVGMNSGKRGLVGATGTPIANSMAEMWTMQTYFQPQYLRDHGLQHFDAWAQTFGEVQPTLEMSPDGGGLRIVNRFNKFVNIPELVAGFRLMADVQTAEMLNLPVPKLKGGKMRTISAKSSEQQMAYLQSLVKRAAAIKGKPVKKGGDNMLVIGTDGQKSALDIRLVDPGAPDNPTSKVNKAVDEIVKIWKQTSDKRSTQLVFLDRSTPAGPREHKFSVYDDMKAKLIARGIPKAEVAFIHDAETDAEKENLFRNVNAGKIRIVIGGTQKMGVGVNVQRKLYAAHHLDAPYRPRDIEQRNGRILRQGNENPEVEIVNYVTEPSFDARSWDILRNKAYFIGQVMRGDVSVRTAEDISDQAVTFAEISAIASGNPAIREKTIVDSEVRKLDSLRARHSQQQAAIRRDLQNLPMTIKAEHDGLARLEADIATRDSSKPEFTIRKETFTGKDARKQAGEALHKVLEEHRNDADQEPIQIGSYRGLKLRAIRSNMFYNNTRDLPRVVISGKGGYEANTNQHGDPDGTLTSIESIVRNLDGRKNQAVRAIEDAEKKLVDTKKLAGHPFEQEQKLKELLARQDELAKQLQAKPAEQAVGVEDADLDTDHPEDLDDLQAMKQEVKAKSVKADAGSLGSESGSAIFPDSAAKALQKAALAVKQARHDILSMVAPAANAPETALTVRQRAAQLARSDARAEAALEDARKALRMIPAAERWDAYDRAELGVPQVTPELDFIFSVMRKLLDDSRRDVQGLGTGKLESFIENYLPHVYKNPQQAEAMFAAYYAKNPLEGKKSFLKKRKYETLKDAMDAGLEPITDNPVDQVLIKVHEMQKYVMAHRILHDEKDAGRVKYYNVKQKPHGVGEINDKISTVFGPHMVDPQHPGMPFITIVGHYYATNEDEARIINNYLSPGLRGVPLFRGYLAMANTMNQFQLGFSAFHLGFVTMDAAISKTALGIYQTAHGSPLKGAVSVLSTPIAPFMNIIRGDKMLKEYYKPGTQGGRLGTLVDAMVMAGGRARMDTFYQAQTARNAADIMRQASLLSRGIGAAIGGALGSTMGPAGTVAGAGLGATFGARGLADVFAKPIMEYLVPRMKMGVFADLAEFELQRLGEGRLTDEEIQAALARAWDSVDNRMGQLVYDNLFWKKSHKDLLMASVRSVGWNTGTIREVGGGVADLKLLATGRPAIGMKNTPGGWSPEVSTRLSYAIALPIVAGIVGSIIYYLSTGEHPETLKDRYFPRSGARGTPGWSKRLSLPTYIKDIVHVHHKGIVDTVQGKLHPFLTLLGDMLNNEDYYGDQIHNWNDPMVKQAQAVASHILESYTPMTMKPPAGKRPPVETTRDKVLKFGGITPAPKYIQDNARTPRGYRRIPVYAP